MKFLEKTNSFLIKFEKFLLVFFLLFLLCISFFQVILRNISSALSISWFDLLSRQLTLWLGLCGACIASNADRHISIDIFTRFFSESIKRYIKSLLFFFSSIFCAILFVEAIKNIQLEKQIGYVLFTIELFNLKFYTWYFALFLPFSYFLMSFHFLFQAFFKIKTQK